jgi:hypothetical protein
VPGFSTSPAQLEATVKAIADHGAAFVGANLMYLKGGSRDHFLGFIAREFPHMTHGFEELYAGAYLPRDYAESVRGMVRALQQRYGIPPRAAQLRDDGRSRARVEEERAAPAQAALEW